jgi:hypothetical protein
MYLILRYRGITLPTIANPTFSGGGFYGESKSQILELVRNHLGDKIAPFVCVRRTNDTIQNLAEKALVLMQTENMDFPVVAKPDMGCRGAGVQPVYTKEQLASYLQSFPIDADVILQSLVAFEGEAGIFYVREPSEQKGRIISLTLKYFPYVTGDGQSTIQSLIQSDPRASKLQSIYIKRFRNRLAEIPKVGEKIRLVFAGNHSKGAIFRNGSDYITPEMQKMFDDMSKQIPGFFFGRYDIRFADFEKLQHGIPEFKIIEVNGGGAEVTHIWDSRTNLFKAWRDVMMQYRLLWKIGDMNRAKGNKPVRLSDFIRAYRREKELTTHYPETL